MFFMIDNFKRQFYTAYMKTITGMTISEMAKELKLPRDTIMRRILRGGYKPLTKDALYTIAVFEAIKNVPGKGRPKKSGADAKASRPRKKKSNA